MPGASPPGKPLLTPVAVEAAPQPTSCTSHHTCRPPPTPPCAGEALLEAHLAGMDVIVKEAMANGRLLQRPQCLKALKAVAEKLASTSPGGGGEGGPDAVALAIAMAQPFHPMVLSGAASVAHLRWVQEKGGT